MVHWLSPEISLGEGIAEPGVFIMLTSLIILLVVFAISLFNIRLIRSRFRKKGKMQNMGGDVRFTEGAPLTGSSFSRSSSGSQEAPDPSTFGDTSLDSMWGTGSSALRSGRTARKSRAKRTSAGSAPKASRKVRIVRMIIILIIVLVLVLIATAVIMVHVEERKTRNGEVLNVYSYDAYQRTDYNVEGDPVIMDQAGIRLSVEGIYAEPDDFFIEEDGKDDINKPLKQETQDPTETTRFMKVGLQVNNDSDREVRIQFDVISANGIAINYSVFVGDTFKPHETSIVYEEVYGIRSGVIKDMILGNFDVMDKDYHSIYTGDSLADQIKVTTDLDVSFDTPETPDGAKLLFEKDGIRIYSARFRARYDDERYERRIWICNDTDISYAITCDRPTQAGDRLDDFYSYLREGDSIPARTVLVTEDIYPYVKPEEAAKYDDRKIETAFHFKSEEDPSKDFDTDPLWINDYGPAPEKSSGTEAMTEWERHSGTEAITESEKLHVIE